MVRILTPGRTDAEMWPYTVVMVCYRCGCEFKVESGDRWRTVQVRRTDPRGDDYTETQVALACPNCGREVTGR